MKVSPDKSYLLLFGDARKIFKIDNNIIESENQWILSIININLPLSLSDHISQCFSRLHQI